MLHLLQDIEWQIKLLRSRPQSRFFRLIGHFRPQGSSQDRKVNESEATGEPKVGKKTA